MEIADTLYAWVTDTPDGEVNIVGAFLPTLGHVPLCFASERIARSVGEIAQRHAQTHQQPVRLVRFKSDGVLERFEP